MSITITSIWFARHRPAAASRRRALTRLTLMLARDEQVRPRPPVTLPESPRVNGGGDAGKPPTIPDTCPAAAAPPPPALTSRIHNRAEMGRRADRFDKARARASEPGDQQNGDWTHEQLVKMDARFRRRLGQAINRGLEQAP